MITTTETYKGINRNEPTNLEALTVDDFGDYYGVYYKLNKKAGADYRKENF